MLFNERSFEDESFDFVVGDDKLDVGNLTDQFAGLDAVAEVAGASGLEIRADTIAQVLRFTDVDYFSAPVLVQIDPRRARNFFEFFVERHGVFNGFQFILAL